MIIKQYQGQIIIIQSSSIILITIFVPLVENEANLAKGSCN